MLVSPPTAAAVAAAEAARVVSFARRRLRQIEDHKTRAYQTLVLSWSLSDRRLKEVAKSLLPGGVPIVLSAKEKLVIDRSLGLLDDRIQQLCGSTRPPTKRASDDPGISRHHRRGNRECPGRAARFDFDPLVDIDEEDIVIEDETP